MNAILMFCMSVPIVFLLALIVVMIGVMTFFENIGNLIKFLYALPAVAFGGYGLLMILAGLFDKNLGIEVIKQGGSIFGGILAIMLIFYIMYKILSLVFEGIIDFLSDFFKSIIEFFKDTIPSFLDNIIGLIVNVMPSIVQVKEDDGQYSKTPKWVWILQVIVYLPVYITGAFFYLVFKIHTVLCATFAGSTAFWFVVINLIYGIGTKGERNFFVFLRYFYNRDWWNDFVAAGETNAPLAASSVTHIIFYIFWACFVYIVPALLLGYLTTASAEDIKTTVMFDTTEEEFTNVFESLNRKTEVMYRTNKGSLFIGYGIAVIGYIAIGVGIVYLYHYFLLH